MLRRGALAFITLCLCLLGPATILSAPIHNAAKRGDLALVQRLLNRGADIDQRDDERSGTPLFYAVLTGHHDVVDYLLLKGANVHAVTAKGVTILQSAAMAGNVDTARLLRKRIGDINQADSNGVTPLDLAIFAGQRDYVAYLIDAGALERKGAAKLPLHRALTSKHEDIAQLLIEAGVGIGEHDDGRVTPLHIAANLGYEGVVRALIARGANVDAEDIGGTTPLFAAAAGGNPAIVKILLDNGAAVNHFTIEHNTALIPAASRGDVEVMRTLLNAGADPNIATTAGATPLIMAVQARRSDVVTLLLEHKADVNSASVIGDTALTVAIMSGQRAVVETLLQHGANINMVRADGTTALDLSVEMRNHDLADLLRARGALPGKLGDAKPIVVTSNDGGDDDTPADAAAKGRGWPLVVMASPMGMGLSTAYGPPPKGYAWQLLPMINTIILMPDNWHLLAESNDKVDGLFLSREDIANGGIFRTGLIINAVRKAGIWSGRSVDEFAQQEDRRVFELPNVKVDDTWASDQSEIKQYGARYRIMDSAGHEHTAVKLTIVNKQSQSVYFVIFESLSREWSASEAIGRTMIGSFGINPEY